MFKTANESILYYIEEYIKKDTLSIELHNDSFEVEENKYKDGYFGFISAQSDISKYIEEFYEFLLIGSNLNEVFSQLDQLELIEYLLIDYPQDISKYSIAEIDYFIVEFNKELQVIEIDTSFILLKKDGGIL
jgi:hypothetical protein